MLKNLNNLSIRKKFAIAIIPLLVIIIIFDILQIRENYKDYHDSVRLNKAIVLGIEINHAIHELQKERAITTGYLSNSGAIFTEELKRQRSVTDSTLSAYYNEIENPDLDDLVELHQDDIENLNSYFERLSSLRRQVDQFSLTPDEAIDKYSEIDEYGLNTVNRLISESRDKKAAEQVHAIIYFLKVKERASIERAIGTQAFSNQLMNNVTHARLSSLVASQKSYLDAFLTIADQQSINYYFETVSGNDIVEVERMEKILMENENLIEDPGYWYEMMTNKINLLKKTEDFMSENIHEYTESHANASVRTFWTFLMVDLIVGTLTLWLVGYIITNLIRNVQRLEAFTKRVSRGDLSKKVVIPTQDELGQYAKTFNVMVNEIRKSHRALRKAKIKAEYLYENIYKKYAMVFANVEQGIFLLDKNFKISKLYSKAMERIFDNKNIAGEEFSNFMRTRLIPRDLEALEMFMKHLFNPDIDEEVLSQLNPVDQVKIFTETNGVIKDKYIRFSFTRIIRKGEIQNILVTVLDETESVLLQRHLEDSEAKKKQEMEQMLSILKIEPTILKDYISHARETLRSISERYENDKKQDFSELINFTFQTIHSLKGNAMVIDLDIMKNKFHDIEDSIGEIKNKKIAGNDFLTILYEINDADFMLASMSDMLQKVANVYHQISSGGADDLNHTLIETLRSGMDKLNKETGKTTEFTFKNNENIEIPDEYQNPVKDILIQLIRNSIAHGIEEPNIRVSKKKLIKGNISVTLETSSEGQLVIKYKDDGKGLDVDKIIDRASGLNLITKEEEENPSLETVQNILFNEGFSTADKVNTLAGRGHGMNVIKSIVDKYHGDLSLNFKKDRYFEMEIKLPLPEPNKKEKVS